MGCGSSKESAPVKSGGKPQAAPSKTANGQVGKPSSSSGQQNRRFSDVYTMGEVLGQGSFSIVKTATNIKTGQKVAVKIVNKFKLHQDDIDAFLREVEILRTLDHPNIVQMVDFFDEAALYYLVLEYVGGGELIDRLIEKAAYTEAEARDIMATMFRALKYIHDKGLVHRDIKPENILLVSRTDDVSIKLADFGFCVDASSSSSTQPVGTPAYVSPEVIEKRPHGPPVDLWAMGVVLFMLLGGYSPFNKLDDNHKQMYRRILAAEYEFHPENWTSISEEAKDLIRKLLVVNPEIRLSAEQALNHPWLRKPREEFALVPLDRTLMALRDYRATRTKQAQVLASVTIDVIRRLSGVNVNKPATVGEVVIDVMRKFSTPSVDDAVIEAARKRSGMSESITGRRSHSTGDVYKNTPPRPANNSASAALTTDI